MFAIIIGVLEKFFADELIQYMERYHADQKAHAIANAPQTKAEEINYWDGHD